MLLDESVVARGLRELRAARAALAAAERLLVVEARREHGSWREIGEQLGVRPQTVWERYHVLDPRPPRRRTLDDDVRDFPRHTVVEGHQGTLSVSATVSASVRRT